MTTTDTGPLDGEALLRIARAVERLDVSWREGGPIVLEDLLQDVAGAERRALLRDALYVELKHRRDRGETPEAGEYERRFPGDAAAIRSVFAEPETVAKPAEVTTEPRTSGSFETDWPVAPAPLPEKVGKYVVLNRLGKGGQGATYLARDADLGKLVVLKRYHASARDQAALDEARALTRVQNRHVARCIDLVRDGDAAYLVLEYIAGPNLEEVIEHGKMPPDAAARLVEEVAEGLEAVHACGMLHRDLKPANVVRGEDGVPRLVDFGLVAHLGSPALRGLSGTIRYMAPEQARDEWTRIDFRTDVYGLGGVLYALLTGQPPHPGPKLEALAHAGRGDLTPPRALNRAVPRALERIVLKALAPDPAQRYATATEFREALRRYRQRHRRRAAVVLAVAVAAVGLFAIRPRRDDQIPAPTPPVLAPLTAELTVRVWSKGAGGKRGLKVDEPGALPVRAGEMVHLETRLNRPAYAYLLWLDGQGNVLSMYPWRDRKFGDLPPSGPARETLQSPPELDQGWPMEGPPGLETALLLVRDTPLPPKRDLAALIGTLPPSPLDRMTEVAVRGFNQGQPVGTINYGLNRGLGDRPKQIDDPLLRLMERLRSDFEVIRAVRFAYRGE